MEERQIWHSQNFLKRPEYVWSLIDKTNLSREDLVVEIGPGKGIITKKLASKVEQVIAVELDHKLANFLRDEFRNIEKVKIVEADFLKWQLPIDEYKVFSNIPFNMTADIVRKITADKNPPKSAYLIMQDKAAFRFMGKPIESQASILLKPWFDIKILEKINRNEFIPVPNVNAVLAEISKKENPQIDPKQNQWYRDFVIYGYNQWQPTILDSYKDILTSKQRSIIAREIHLANKKPSDLNLEEWLRLFNTFSKYVPPEKKEVVKGAEQRLEIQQMKATKWHRTR